MRKMVSNASNIKRIKKSNKIKIKTILTSLISLILIMASVVCLYIWRLLEQPVQSIIPIVTGGKTPDGILDSLADPEDQDTASKPSNYVTPTWGNGRVKVYVNQNFPIFKVEPKDKNIENVLLIGLDARAAYDTQSRTDSILLVSINKANNSISLSSFMRDIQVKIAGRTNPSKINAAYVFGGIGLLINTLNENFDLDIQKFAMVDMWSAENVINSAGGVVINVNKSEIPFVNGGIDETNYLFQKISKPVEYISKSGNLLLNGRQAVSYGRIRYIGNDQGRTLRQRTVLSALIKSYKESNITRKMSIFEESVKAFETNLDKNELLFLAIDTVSAMKNIRQYRIPEDGMSVTNNKNWNIEIDYSRQNPALHKFIYGYETEMSSKSVSDESIADTSLSTSSGLMGDSSPPSTSLDSSSDETSGYDNNASTAANSNQ